MPQPLRKQYYNAHTPAYVERGANVYAYPPQSPLKSAPRKRVKPKVNPFVMLFAAFVRLVVLLGIFCALVYYVIPYNFTTYFEPMILSRFLNRNLTLNAKEYLMPTLKYLSNADFNGNRLLVPVRTPGTNFKPEMVPLAPSSRMYALEIKLKSLSSKYSNLKPSIYVWDYSNSRSAEINSHSVYSSASIIKLPVLIELFRRSEALKNAGYKPVDFSSKLLFDDIHKTSGSGSLQYKRTGEYYTIDYLARIMIQESDNSATNMLLEQIGGMSGLNAAARRWGLTSTGMSNWLPDLKGTNTISAYDMAVLLYNIDNPSFLNDRSRYMIKSYMSNVHNRSLLQAGLPKGADLLHKTGDIGTMLGDAGIIYAPNGRKYIAVVLTERPFNDYSARDFIKQASSIIYDYVVQRPDMY